MKAKLENDIINVYNEKNQLIGGIKINSNHENADIVVGVKRYQLSRNKMNTKILENGVIKYNLKSNLFSGNTEVKETGRKITGVFGLKWGTQMIDNQKNTLIKIRNENQFVDKKRYEIEISNKRVTDLEILTTLYGHIYGSNMKTQILMVGVIGGIGAIIFFT